MVKCLNCWISQRIGIRLDLAIRQLGLSPGFPHSIISRFVNSQPTGCLFIDCELSLSSPTRLEREDLSARSVDLRHGPFDLVSHATLGMNFFCILRTERFSVIELHCHFAFCFLENLLIHKLIKTSGWRLRK